MSTVTFTALIDLHGYLQGRGVAYVGTPEISIRTMTPLVLASYSVRPHAMHQHMCTGRVVLLQQYTYPRRAYHRTPCIATHRGSDTKLGHPPMMHWRSTYSVAFVSCQLSFYEL